MEIDDSPIDLDAYVELEDESLSGGSSEDTQGSVNEGPKLGILYKAVDVLASIAADNFANGNDTLCALLIDEIKLIQKYEKFEGKVWGYTEGLDQTKSGEPKKMASKAMVFMAISLTDDWKMPIGLFFVHNPDIKYIADAIEETLTCLHGINIFVLSITFGLNTGLALAEELGAEIDVDPLSSKKIQPFFQHSNNTVYILYDLNSVLDAIKNLWAHEDSLVYSPSQKIVYSLITKCHNVTENDMRQFGSDAAVDWFIIKKRLKYATRDFSKNLADAMEYLYNKRHPDFCKCKRTTQFIRIIDFLTEIADVCGLEGLLYKSLSKENKDEWLPALQFSKRFIKRVRTKIKKNSNGKFDRTASVLNQFNARVRVTIISLVQLYENYVIKHDTLKGILPYRLGVKNIKFGLLDDDWQHEKVTALTLYKKLIEGSENVLPIGVQMT